MNDNSHKRYKFFYDIAIIILAIVSIVLVILDICGKISISGVPFIYIDYGILIVFAVDYIVRFIAAEQKWDFFKHNVFDLLAIIPFDSIFSLFRFARIFRALKFVRFLKITKTLRIVAVFGKLKHKIDRFLHTNGFIYMIYTSAILIIISSVLMSYFEGKTFLDALWWSIVTTTTVGYGDISPATGVGRFIAVVLMLFGIGFISMLTGTITSYFSNKVAHEDEKDSDVDIHSLIDSLSDEERRKIEYIVLSVKEGKI